MRSEQLAWYVYTVCARVHEPVRPLAKPARACSYSPANRLLLRFRSRLTGEVSFRVTFYAA
jgi:hypothetical protein